MPIHHGRPLIPVKLRKKNVKMLCFSYSREFVFIVYTYVPLAICTAYSHVPILGVILGVKTIYKHAKRELEPKTMRIVWRTVLYCVRNQ